MYVCANLTHILLPIFCSAAWTWCSNAAHAATSKLVVEGRGMADAAVTALQRDWRIMTAAAARLQR